jgi:hypothetical protein
MTERLFLAYDYNKTMAWGGFHITLIGKGNKMPFNNIKRTSLYNGKKKWTFSSAPVAKLTKWKGVWTIVFQSKTIDQLANELISLGFSSVKGPITGTPWHISLNGVDKILAEDIFNYFVKSSKRPRWYLTICKEHSNGHFTWKRL